MNFILRVYSFLFCLPVTLLFFGIGAVALMEGAYNLNLPMLPWTGAALTYWIFGLSLAGMICILLALQKKMRLLYVLYALGIFGLAMYGVFLSGMRFDSATDFQWALGFCAGAFGAAIGAILHARTPSQSRGS